MTSTPLRVAVRIRPVQSHDGAREGALPPIVLSKVAERKLEVRHDGFGKDFEFETIFGPGASQHEVYTKCAAPLVDAVLDARNACIFAFGSTGAGKTFSMLGPEGGRKGSSNDGILPRVASELFRNLEILKADTSNAVGGCQCDYQVRVTFLEIFREAVFDLLNGPVSSSRDPSQSLSLREEKDGRVYAEGAREDHVHSTAELLKLVARGAAARATAATGVHAHSSRSHALLTLAVERRWRDPRDADGTKIRSQTSRFTLVDLAGAEGMERAHQGQVDLAGVGTNMGLLVLGRVLQALASGARVPYRDSTLTRLMQTGLGGNAVTHMLACVAPTARDLDISLHTLSYASGARDIKASVSAAAISEELDHDPMAGDFDDEDEALNRRTIWIETGYGDVFARCAGDPAAPLLLYVHGSGPQNSSMNWNMLVVDVERLAKDHATQNRGGCAFPSSFFHVAIDCPGYGRSPGNRQTIRSYPGGLLSSIVAALGRKSAVALIGSSQGACAVFNCALECPELGHTLAVCHPVGHAPQRYTKISQPSLLIFDIEDAGHPVEVGRQMRRYLQDARYFEFARSVDGDWECNHMGEELVKMLVGSWPNIDRRKAGGRRLDRMPELTRVSGGFRSWNEAHGSEWLPWCGLGEFGVEPEPPSAAAAAVVAATAAGLSEDSNDAWRAEVERGTNGAVVVVYRHIATGRTSKIPRPKGAAAAAAAAAAARILVEEKVVGGAAQAFSEPAGIGMPSQAVTTAQLFDDSSSEDSDVEERRREMEAQAAQEQAEKERTQERCDLCQLVLWEPLRLATCRCALCACCVERTVRYFRQCPVCGEAVKVQANYPASIAETVWLGWLRGRTSTQEIIAQQELLNQMQLLQARTTRILLEYGSVSAPGGGKTSWTTFVRFVSGSGAASGGRGVLDKVDFNINPGYSKPTASQKSPNNKKLGFAFEYAMARPYPCFMTLHFAPSLKLPKVLLEFEVQEAPKLSRRLIIQSPSERDEAGGWRPSDFVTVEAECPKNCWIRCSAGGKREAAVEYLPEQESAKARHYADAGPVFAHAPSSLGASLGCSAVAGGSTRSRSNSTAAAAAAAIRTRVTTTMTTRSNSKPRQAGGGGGGGGPSSRVRSSSRVSRGSSSNHSEEN